MAQKNTTAFIVLGLLSHEDSSGYDLKKKVEHMISQFWDVGYGQLYPTLKTLEQEGSVTGIPTPSEKGPDRIVYSITESGRQKLKEWLRLPNEKEYIRYEILLKLFFGSLSTPEDNLKRIEAFREQHESDLTLIQQYQENLKAVMSQSDDHLYYYLTTLFGEHIYRAYVEWAKEAAALIKDNLKQKEGSL